MDDISNTVSEIGQSIEPYARVAQSLASLVKAFPGKKAADGTDGYSGIEHNELLEIVTAAQLAAIEAQEVQAVQSARKRKLEEEVRQHDDWEREKERYFLKQVGQAAFAYCLKDDFVCDNLPRHFICPTCAEEARKTIVHLVRHNSYSQSLCCPLCKTRIPCGKSPLVDST